ncbi:MAG: MBL fold metallo-hydrolase [Lachnospiraceae bacterium]|nr:MBL fold metallo-hydrolase [Lachnospiraceae bacterium]
MGELKIGRMVLGSCATNTYFLYREGENKAVVVDPADQGTKVYASLFKNDLKVEGILLTHGHFDHIWGLEALKGAVNRERKEKGLEPIKVYALDAERELLGNADMNVSEMAGRACTVSADEYLKDGQEITIAGMTFKVIATPGHTSGSCCYYLEEKGFLLSGDTLFLESVGRTDFPTGSMSQIVRSIREKLFVLPEDTKVYPGHGGSTTIGYEKENNPFCV